MDTRQLEYFVAVAEELNFTRAAGRLFTVQSTVSASIRTLEADLGTPLFDRSSKRVALTAAGESLLPEALAAIEAIDRVRSAAALSKVGIRGRLRVGILTNVDFLDLPGVFGAFHSHHPLVDLQLGASPSGSTGLADDVRRGRIDIAFMGLAPEDLAGFQVLRLAISPMVVVLPKDHPLTYRKTLGLEEIARERFVDSSVGFGNRVAVERGLAGLGLSRSVPTEVADLGQIPQFVAAGLGIAIVPKVTLRTTPGVVEVPLASPGLQWQLSAICRPTPSPAVSALLQLLGERFGG
jgi:DNA-binding transcriptional LysR family regulator